jgi:1-acyl-sn-glycerol-3-phosphate acyltransferase
MIALAHELTFHAVTGSIRGLTELLCDVDARELSKIPSQGPLILFLNHINFLDVPLIFCRLLPRPITGFAKSETWDDPLLGPLFTLWGAIPLHRGQADTTALRKGVDVLKCGGIVGITPEGTRSGDGILQRAHPGVVTLALHSGAPLLPVAMWGNEKFHGNFRRLRRTPVNFRVGNLLRIDPAIQHPRGELRQAIADELMYCLADLLPPFYKGVYANHPGTYRYIFQLDKGEAFG